MSTGGCLGIKGNMIREGMEIDKNTSQGIGCFILLLIVFGIIAGVLEYRIHKLDNQLEVNDPCRHPDKFMDESQRSVWC
jgi:hypothetical protein